MPQLNLAHVARSARFAERLTIIRRQETVGNDGILTLVPTTITPAPYGTVTADSSNLVRSEDQQHMPKSISVVTPFKLRGPSNSGSNSYQPDIIVWRGDQYIVERLDDYSAYGEGWTQAICASIDAIDIAPPGP